MTTSNDPFLRLRDDGTAAPKPARRFARQLRNQIEAALAPPIDLPDRKDTPTMSTTTPGDTTRGDDVTDEAVPVVTARQIITPYISVHDGAGALDWYVTALGATETVRYVGDDGRIGHAEFVLHGATVMLSDAYPEIGVVAANSSAGSSCALHVEVPDCDAAHERAVANGATSMAAPADQPHGSRNATILDPFGHRWMLSQPVRAMSYAEIDEQYDGFDVVPNERDDNGG
jgi:PhnB protein